MDALERVRQFRAATLAREAQPSTTKIDAAVHDFFWKELMEADPPEEADSWDA